MLQWFKCRVVFYRFQVALPVRRQLGQLVIRGSTAVISLLCLWLGDFVLWANSVDGLFSRLSTSLGTLGEACRLRQSLVCRQVVRVEVRVRLQQFRLNLGLHWGVFWHLLLFL